MREAELMLDAASPCGVWRLSVRRLGASRRQTDAFGLLARIEVDGTVTVFGGGSTTESWIGAWRSAGPGRVVVVAESLFTGRPGSAPSRLCTRAAVELADAGRSYRGRLQWQRIDLEGRNVGVPVWAEAEAVRLAP